MRTIHLSGLGAALCMMMLAGPASAEQDQTNEQPPRATASQRDQATGEAAGYAGVRDRASRPTGRERDRHTRRGPDDRISSWERADRREREWERRDRRYDQPRGDRPRGDRPRYRDPLTLDDRIAQVERRIGQLIARQRETARQLREMRALYDELTERRDRQRSGRYREPDRHRQGGMHRLPDEQPPRGQAEQRRDTLDQRREERHATTEQRRQDQEARQRQRERQLEERRRQR